jgi:phosphohistidine phosphatase
MKIYLIRHGDAVEVGEGEVKEVERYLTARGREEMRRVAEKLVEMGVRFDGVLTSPLVRAVQTAEIVVAAVGFEGPVEACPALAAGRWTRKAIAEALAERDLSGSYALVGHNPDMERIASALLGVSAVVVPFEKGTVCLIEGEGEPFQNEGRFRWALRPRDLGVIQAIEKLRG